jgi:hypothetical protein
LEAIGHSPAPLQEFPFIATEKPSKIRSSSFAPQPGQTTLPLSFSAIEQRTSNFSPQELH